MHRLIHLHVSIHRHIHTICIDVYVVYVHIHCLNIFKLIYIQHLHIYKCTYTTIYMGWYIHIYLILFNIYVHIHLYLHIYTFVCTNKHAYTVFHINANIHIHALYDKVAYIVMTMNPFMIYKMNLAWTSHLQVCDPAYCQHAAIVFDVTSAFLSSLRKYFLRNWQFHLKELIQIWRKKMVTHQRRMLGYFVLAESNRLELEDFVKAPTWIFHITFLAWKLS